MQQLLGLTAASQNLWDEINAMSEHPDERVHDVNVYTDCIYYNFNRLGMSFMFKPISDYKLSPKDDVTSLNLESLVLDGIDMYNAIGDEPQDLNKTADKLYKPFRRLPLVLHLSHNPTEPSSTEAKSTNPLPSTLSLERSTTGKDLVSSLGEPARKGGGGGPSGGSIAIWCDWTIHGVMVEFGGIDARGPKAWENGKDARWAILSLYKPSAK